MYYYGMAAVPEWAPPGENHLLRSSSVVQSITYTNSGVSYTTWDPASTEVFRLSSVPSDVLTNGIALPRRGDLAQPGWTYDANSGVLRVRHDSATQIQVVYAPPLPRLSARCEGANLLLSWPTNFTGFLLEYLTTPGTNWLTLTGAPAVVNDQFTITNAISASGEFYRLRQP